MRKVFRLNGLCCANCAAKMERRIQKIKGIQEASVSFMAQKLTIEAAEEDFDRIMKEAVKAVKKVDSDCSIVL